MKPRYPHRKQFKIDYETQFLTDSVLNNEIRNKNSIKNKIKKNYPSLLRLTL